MKLGKLWGSALSLGVLLLTGVASAQEAPAAAPAREEGHASGVMVQGRMLANGGLLSLGSGPGFLIGYQAPTFALGLGLSLNRLAASAGDETAALTLFQFMPTAIVDVWHSKDGRARANLIGGVGYGRAAVSGTDTSRNCVFDALGNQTCTTEEREFSTGAGYVPLMLGFGGDYFLSRNFALGAEVGLQAAFTTGIDEKSGSNTRSIDGAGNLQMAYGAVRATFVLGD